MRQALAASILLLALSGTPAAQVDYRLSAQSQIRQLNAELIQGYMHNDAGTLNRIFADDYTFIDDDGRFLTKPHIVESFRSGDHHVLFYKMSEESVRLYGAAAIMTYRYLSKETYKGQEYNGDGRITRVFAKKNGRWQIVAGQETRMASRK